MASDQHEHGDGKVVATAVVTRPVGVTCGWCRTWIPYSGRGRPARYCCKAHRNRAWEQRRAHHELAAGELVDEPVREVLERVVTVVREVAYETTPTTGAGWHHALIQLAEQLAAGRLGDQHWHHPKLLAALDEVLHALQRAYPGGLAAAERRRILACPRCRQPMLDHR
jgi:hypothetical protein